MQVTEADLERYAHGSSLRLYAVAELAKIGNGNNQYTGGSGGGKDSGESSPKAQWGGPRNGVIDGKMGEHQLRVSATPGGKTLWEHGTGKMHDGSYKEHAHGYANSIGEGKAAAEHSALGLLKEVMHAGTELGGKVTGPMFRHGGE